MAMIKCSECGKDISDKATECVHCGNPLEEILEEEDNRQKSNKKTDTKLIIYGIISVIIVIILLIIGITANNLMKKANNYRDKVEQSNTKSQNNSNNEKQSTTNINNSDIQQANKSYIGTWYTDGKYDDLTISEINDKTIEFQMGFFRLTTITGTGSIENDKIDFVSNDGRNITGTMELKQNSVFVTINKSDYEHITDGTTINFTIKE